MALNAPANPPRPTFDRSMVAMDRAGVGRGVRVLSLRERTLTPAFIFFITRVAATGTCQRVRAVGLGGGVERHGWRETRPAWTQFLPSPAQPHRPPPNT